MEKFFCGKPSLSLRDISPRGRDKLNRARQKPSSLRKVARRKPRRKEQHADKSV